MYDQSIIEQKNQKEKYDDIIYQMKYTISEENTFTPYL